MLQKLSAIKSAFFAVDISRATGGTGSAAQELRGLGETARGPIGAPQGWTNNHGLRSEKWDYHGIIQDIL